MLYFLPHWLPPAPTTLPPVAAPRGPGPWLIFLSSFFFFLTPPASPNRSDGPCLPGPDSGWRGWGSSPPRPVPAPAHPPLGAGPDRAPPPGRRRAARESAPVDGPERHR